ncbi:hypothetical protein PZA11_006047 [Diplocarpon coronariae]
MKLLYSVLCSLALFTATHAGDMSAYEPSVGVEKEFKDFITKFYIAAEDPSDKKGFTSFWIGSGSMVMADEEYRGWASINDMRQSLLRYPPGHKKSWWHIIRHVTVRGETKIDKTYEADITIQITSTPGACTESYGKAAFTILKDEEGKPRLLPGTMSMRWYQLTLQETSSADEIPCSPRSLSAEE